MRTSGILLAPALYLLWLSKHAVESAQLWAPKEVTAAYGGSVTVSCHYQQRFRDHTKYWCKGKTYELCEIVVKTPRPRLSKGSSIADNKDAGVFNITMTSLRKSDDDWYWCVIARVGRNIYTDVRLRIALAATTTITPTSSSPLTTQSETSWWSALRWILFILMLCCLVSTHTIAWRIKTARKIWPDRQIQPQSSNMYE